jgi:hypothetical protein
MWLRCDSPHGHPRPDRGAGLRAARRRGHSMPDEPSGEELLVGSIWCIGIASPSPSAGRSPSRSGRPSPAPPLDMPEVGGAHHIGYWAGDRHQYYGGHARA